MSPGCDRRTERAAEPSSARSLSVATNRDPSGDAHSRKMFRNPDVRSGDGAKLPKTRRRFLLPLGLRSVAKNPPGIDPINLFSD